VAELRGYIIALVVFVGVTTGMLQFSGSLFETYDTGMQDSSEFQQFRDLKTEVKTNVSAEIERGREQTGLIGGAIESGVFILSPIWQIMKMVANTMTAYPAIIGTFIGIGGFPQWVQNLVWGVISVGILFGIVSVFRGVRS